MSQFLWFFLVGAVLQNVVLLTGFGSSVLLKTAHKRRNILPFGALLCLFSVLTVLVCYPLDMLIGTGIAAKWFRPLMIFGVTAALYCLVVPVMKRFAPKLYARAGRLVPLAAFNNLVIGIALIVNHQFVLSLWGTLGLSLGACAGFLLVSWLIAEGIERLDNPDVPKAFRGLPAVLLYLGILSLALMGFSGSISLL